MTGTIFTIQALLLPTYSIIFSRYHEVNILSPVFSFFMNIFGLKTSIVRNIIFIQTNVNVIPFLVTFEKLGVYLLLNILVGSLIIFALSNKKRENCKKYGLFADTIINLYNYKIYSSNIHFLRYKQNEHILGSLGFNYKFFAFFSFVNEILFNTTREFYTHRAI